MAALRIAYWLPVLVWACRDRRRVSTWLEVRNLSGVTIQVPRGMAGRSVIDQVRFGQGFGEPFSTPTLYFPPTRTEWSIVGRSAPFQALSRACGRVTECAVASLSTLLAANDRHDRCVSSVG